MKKEIAKSKHHNPRQRGASLVECALLVALISVGSIVAVRNLGNKINDSLALSQSQLEAGNGQMPSER